MLLGLVALRSLEENQGHFSWIMDKVNGLPRVRVSENSRDCQTPPSRTLIGGPEMK